MYTSWTPGPRVNGSLFDHIISARNPTDTKFLTPVWPDHLHDPLLLPDIKPAVARIEKALSTRESIAIVGDYDMDGTPAAVLFSEFLELFGLAPLVILPTREEGYGFAKTFVDRCVNKNVTLIITADCDVRDVESVAYAREKNIDVIITDHHECPDDLPAAIAVINPKRPDSQYPFNELCGTGVAFKLCQALLQALPKDITKDVPEGWLPWSLDIVAIATISDMVPLVDENRLLATYGLKVLKKTKRIGLERFIEAIGINPPDIDYSDIPFKLTPKCNAAGRMDRMDAVFTMLHTRSKAEADKAIQQILVYNTQSQLLLSTMEAEAHAQVDPDTSLIILTHDTWHPGLTGIVASRLMDKYNKPVGILAPHDDILRGSFRSPNGINITAHLEQATEHIEKFGGHEQAAGLSVAKDQFDAFRNHMLGQTIIREDKPFTTDGEVSADSLTLSVLDQLVTLAPWGVGHSEPLWSFSGVTLTGHKWLKDGAHLKATLNDNGAKLTVLLFGVEPYKDLISQTVDICGTVSINEFRGNREPQFIIRGIKRTT